MHPRTPFILGSLVVSPAFAAGVDISIELPNINVAEYHRPYVAAWLEREDKTVAATLALWYQNKAKPGAPAKAGEGGEKWLPDLRQWWRRAGNAQTLPIDGVSGATRVAGTHKLTFSDSSGALAKLPAGQYKLVVEAAREVGGREVLSVPFTWPPAGQAQTAQGTSELGAVQITATP